MAAAIPVLAGAGVALEAAQPAIEKVFEIANTEILGYHKTTFKYDAKGKLKESHTWNASLKAWELGLMLLVGAAWEAAIMVGDTIKGGEDLAKYFLDPIGTWANEALTALGKGQKVSTPPSNSAGQALNAQLALLINQAGQVIQPIIAPASAEVSRKVQQQVANYVKE